MDVLPSGFTRRAHDTNGHSRTRVRSEGFVESRSADGVLFGMRSWGAFRKAQTYELECVCEHRVRQRTRTGGARKHVYCVTAICKLNELE
jgi:hypothetical protein